MQKLFLFRYDADGPRLGLQIDAARYDLTGVDPSLFGSLGTLLAHPDPLAALTDAAHKAYEPVPDDLPLLAPADVQEVWAAGVTYERSKVARMEESEGGGDFYDKVYVAERPELFMKAVGWRVVAPEQPIRVRRDSTWDVPEPEMTLVVAASGAIIGVTVGNDVSSRSIEGENPLYLPQAKCYNGAAAVGPQIRLLQSGIDLRNLAIRLEIVRDGQSVFADETTTARMKRHPEELVEYLFREMAFPHGALLMTGTGLVPPDTFTLKAGDTVHITIDQVGTLTNPVL